MDYRRKSKFKNSLKYRLLLISPLLVAALLCIVGIVFHVLKFWAPKDKLCFYNNAVLSGTVMLCIFCSVCLLLDLSDEPAARYETLLSFVFIQMTMMVLLIISVFSLGIKWMISERGAEGDPTSDDDDPTDLTVLIVFSTIAIIPLFLFVIVGSMIVFRSSGRLYSDYGLRRA